MVRSPLAHVWPTRGSRWTGPLPRQEVPLTGYLMGGALAVLAADGQDGPWMKLPLESLTDPALVASLARTLPSSSAQPSVEDAWPSLARESIQSIRALSELLCARFEVEQGVRSSQLVRGKSYVFEQAFTILPALRSTTPLFSGFSLDYCMRIVKQ